MKRLSKSILVVILSIIILLSYIKPVSASTHAVKLSKRYSITLTESTTSIKLRLPDTPLGGRVKFKIESLSGIEFHSSVRNPDSGKRVNFKVSNKLTKYINVNKDCDSLVFDLFSSLGSNKCRIKFDFTPSISLDNIKDDIGVHIDAANAMLTCDCEYYDFYYEIFIGKDRYYVYNDIGVEVIGNSDYRPDNYIKIRMVVNHDGKKYYSKSLTCKAKEIGLVGFKNK